MTKSIVEEQEIVVLKADMTHDAPHIEDKLIEFGNTAKAIPYYAVYRPDKAPHHFDGNFVTVGAKGFLERAGIVGADTSAVTKVSLPESGHELDYRLFSRAIVDMHVAAGRTVLVEFSADWDIVSKGNRSLALDTKQTKSALESRNVVVLRADMTETNHEGKKMLLDLGNTTGSIPYYAVFRPGKDVDHFDGNFMHGGAESFLQRSGLSPTSSK